MPTVGERRNSLGLFLAREGIPCPKQTAEVFCCAALGCSRAALFMRGPEEMPLRAEEILQGFLEERLKRCPLEYILGEAFFYGRSFAVGPGCLIPRPETELLVEEVLAYLPEHGKIKIIDWGTGSGCIAATLALEVPSCSCLGVDASPLALTWAWKNLKALGLLGRVHLWHGAAPRDIPWKEGVDLVVSNPPYIPAEAVDILMPEVQREPRGALDGGPDGLDAYRLLFPWASGVLKPGGILGVEIGEDGQVEPLRGMAEAELDFLKCKKDYNGLARILLWRKPFSSR